MALHKVSRAEELARKSQQETELFLEEKHDARKQRTQQIADLKALRLEQDIKREKASAKLLKSFGKK